MYARPAPRRRARAAAAPCGPSVAALPRVPARQWCDRRLASSRRRTMWATPVVPTRTTWDPVVWIGHCPHVTQAGTPGQRASSSSRPWWAVESVHTRWGTRAGLWVMWPCCASHYHHSPHALASGRQHKRRITPAPCSDFLASSIAPRHCWINALLQDPRRPGSAAPRRLADYNLRGCRAMARGHN